MPAKKPEKSRLTAKQQRFVDEYMVDLHGKNAAIRAGYAPKCADQQASQLLKKPHVKAAIDAAQSKISELAAERSMITREAVLDRYWQIATANPNELIQHRRVCCRHCFGVNHSYQWVDEAEWERAVANAKVNDLTPPDNDGGYGFESTIRPHPKCPKCKGEGYGEVFATDTRDLSPQALSLYAGVKQTKEGFEVKMHDQLAALEKVARHLGLFNDKLTLKGDEQNPIVALLKGMAPQTLKPGGDQ